MNTASASASSLFSASQYLHLNHNPNTGIDLRADAESELDAVEALTPDKRVDIARSIRCNTLSAAICYRCNGRRRRRRGRRYDIRIVLTSFTPIYPHSYKNILTLELIERRF